MAAAPVESCQSLPKTLGSPRVGTIHVHAPTPHAPRQALLHFGAAVDFSMNYLAMASYISGDTLEGCRIDGVCGQALTHYQTYPERLQEPICPRKKCVIWTRCARSRKNVNYLEAPQ